MRGILRMMMRRSNAKVFAAAAWLALAMGCSGGGKDQEPAVAVQAATVEQGPIERMVSAEAILFPLHEAALSPKLSAPVKTFFVNRGSKVHAGELLAVLENGDLAASEMENKGVYEQAQANYGNATTMGLPQQMQKAEFDLQQAKQEYEAQQKIYESREELFKQGAIPRKDLDAGRVAFTQAKAQYELAQKTLEGLKSGGQKRNYQAATGELQSAKGKYLGAQAQLSYSELRSPIAGVVTDRAVYPGEMAPAGTPLITVMDLSQILAKAHIPQEQAALLKAGDAATLSVAGSDEKVAGKVTLVSPALDPNSTTVEIWVQSANPKQILRPGAAAKIQIVAQSVADALIIPDVAMLAGDDGQNFVMLISADGHAHKQNVTVGIQQSGKGQIVSGLKKGDRVVTVGAYGLPENAKVEVQAPPAAENAKPGAAEAGDPADEKAGGPR
ncbi:MAG TPA: efflux RND transporter periplasmic adaptor subunit [Terriglobales bacterium]|nr:efflux RND transporter periplasmic adaptor subunit [Terriglobales bacterium]